MPGPTAFQDDAFQNFDVLGLVDAFQVGPIGPVVVTTTPSVGGGGGMAGSWLLSPIGTGFDQAEGMLDLAAQLGAGASSGWWQDGEEEFDWQKSDKPEGEKEADEDGPGTARTKTKTRFTEDLLFLFLAINHALILSTEARGIVMEVMQDQWDAGIRDVSIVTKAVLDALGVKKTAEALARVLKKYKQLKIPPELREEETDEPVIVMQPMPYPVPYVGPQLPVLEEKKPLMGRTATFAVGIVAGLVVAYAAWLIYQSYQEGAEQDKDDEM